MEGIRARLKKAKRPLLLAGHGIRCAGQVQEFRALITHLQLPVVTTQLARDLMPYHHPLYVGSPGVKGDRAGGMALQSCDLLLILGSSLHPTTTGYDRSQFAPQAYKIWIERDEDVIDKYPTLCDETYTFDVKDFLSDFNLPTRLNASEYLAQCHAWKERYDLRNEKRPHPHSRFMDIYHVIDTLSDVALDSDIILADAGSAFYITGQAWRTKENQRVLLPGGLAQMGYTSSAAIGAAFACPHQKILAITGDGSLQTNIHDLAVIAHHQLNVKLIVLNNQGYACIKQTQDRYFYGNYSGVNKETGVSFPKLPNIAGAYNIPYTFISHQEMLRDKLPSLLHKDSQPRIIEILTHSHQEVIPRVESEMREDGTLSSGTLDRMYPYL